MSILNPRRILTVLGGIVLAAGFYMGWQMYQGQQMANQYAIEAQKPVQGSGDGYSATNPQTPGNTEITPLPSSGVTSPFPSSTSQNHLPLLPSSPGSKSSSSSVSPSATATPADYKQLMSSPYTETLQAMQKAKENTLALQQGNLSLSAYKASIIESQAAFTAVETFVRANPPTEAQLIPPYQDFLAGISLANKSMDVVLNGLSSFSPSSIYAAREMGKTAQQKVSNGYAQL